MHETATGDIREKDRHAFVVGPSCDGDFRTGPPVPPSGRLRIELTGRRQETPFR